MKQYVCEKHVDIAMEKVIDEYETAPIVEKSTENEKLSTNCEYCGGESAYMVANIDSDTK
ncbi:CxxH/CxxC protein (TIGR04129 family) [Salirhabdus euzebyi]|uniref:CxxH/CxxC protein (TIGR04129 family) n=1 Tax=Salirhabdus euzebyi TaxID=394506 RepID=A0A841Q808_9BACI|nr:CxxH/CxxC protein [Salirhabdus euzebyi]MBB6454454.1 CxxH/CxxC protein (TIGR04129 family) [Salirhabdus euzebyi]